MQRASTSIGTKIVNNLQKILLSFTHSREPPRPAAALLPALPPNLLELRLEGLQRGAVDEKVAREIDHEEERGDAVAAHGPERRRKRHVPLKAVKSIAAKSDPSSV